MRQRPKTLPGVTRRQMLTWSTAAVAAGLSGAAQAVTLKGAPGWSPFADNPPETVDQPGWLFFTADEAATVEAIVDRLIPADALSIGGKDAGCAVFIDRQLDGFYGTAERLYRQGPFQPGTPAQGDQSPLTPRQRYRTGLAALNALTRQQDGKPFAALSAERQDALLQALESGKTALDGIDSKLFFEQILGNTMEGFFADPIYGGNRDMVSWKMLGFPGARYDYREYVEQHNQPLNLEPVSINGTPQWRSKA
ncbi:gluconate 2-dehydrogenase subunit 3 family protein [Pantoea sp. 1.19]|uniref:gluconate 2-dehydrogenase subunit 3 family protein n=1 Tax=Pantoea sp. 1.19 TaxID=1925589 RepID=UPI00094903AC|nr:gluconate 2-dehydrogenase subunit 3 family protein [Pantoea sp. 1.19]